MRDPIALARTRSLPRLRQRVLRGSPRFAVAGMLALTTLAGFLCSVGLLHLGVGGMAVRYAASVPIAYAVFLAQLGLWVVLARRRGADHSRGPDADPSDLAELALELPGRWQGGGGTFAGGGASGSFGPEASGLADAGATVPGAGSGIDLDFDVDGWEVLAVAVLVLLVASGAVAAGYVVYTAPSLLAEIFFDGVVAGVLYRKLRRGSERAWWQGALSRTWVPALVVFLFFWIGGLVLDHAVPGARSMGDVLRSLAG